MGNDPETLITALQVKTGDAHGGVRCSGRPPRLSASELLCPAVARALPGHRPQSRWMRYATRHMAGMFAYLPARPACTKRLRAALPLVKRIIGTWPATATSGLATIGSWTPSRCPARPPGPR